MNETDTRAKLIDPAMHAAGWTEDEIAREVPTGFGFADYVLTMGPERLAVVEAKSDTTPANVGLLQAKLGAAALDVPVAVATNGRQFITTEVGTDQYWTHDRFPATDFIYGLVNQRLSVYRIIDSLRREADEFWGSVVEAEDVARDLLALRGELARRGIYPAGFDVRFADAFALAMALTSLMVSGVTPDGRKSLDAALQELGSRTQTTVSAGALRRTDPARYLEPIPRPWSRR